LWHMVHLMEKGVHPFLLFWQSGLIGLLLCNMTLQQHPMQQVHIMHPICQSIDRGPSHDTLTNLSSKDCGSSKTFSINLLWRDIAAATIVQERKESQQHKESLAASWNIKSSLKKRILIIIKKRHKSKRYVFSGKFDNPIKS
jgi:hypothetical protein